MISLLLPTRGRAAMLRQTLRLLYDRACSRKTYEVLLRVDDDDQETIAALPELDYDYVLIGPPEGYTDLHVYLNELAVLSRGEWLMLYGDDLRMQTDGWDVKLQETLQGHLCFADATTQYPILSKEAYETLGHFSFCRAADTYLKNVFIRAEVRFRHLQVAINNKIVQGAGCDREESDTIERSAREYGPRIKAMAHAA